MAEPDDGSRNDAAPGWVGHLALWLGTACLSLMLLDGARAQDSPGGARPAGASAQGGEQVYRQICQACHMPDARGGQGATAIPALARNPRLADARYPIDTVLRGRGAMPWFAGTLKPAQVAAVVGYIRTHFGNAYEEPVTEADVLARSQNLPRESD